MWQFLERAGGATQRVSSCQVPKDGAPEPDTLGRALEWLALIGSERRNTVGFVASKQIRIQTEDKAMSQAEPAATHLPFEWRRSGLVVCGCGSAGGEGDFEDDGGATLRRPKCGCDPPTLPQAYRVAFFFVFNKMAGFIIVRTEWESGTLATHGGRLDSVWTPPETAGDVQ